ncbi:MAG: D-alanine--D-alanine ligase [Cyanobacteria bacterium J06643_4]
MSLRILHLVGSATSDFYCDLSVLYARECIDAIADSSQYQFLIAHVSPDKLWRFPVSLKPEDIAIAQPMPLSAAIQYLTKQNANQTIDLAIPQMFCLAGMTDYRTLLTLLNIPYIGNLPAQMAIAANKAQAKAIVAAAGVNVPYGEVLRANESPTLSPPAIVKPNSADNSLGVTLVHDLKQYKTALKTAQAESSEIIVEQYIPLGREVRCGILEQGGKLHCLPIQEYAFEDKDKPIRTFDNKLVKDKNHQLDFKAKQVKNHAWIVEKDDPITPRVWAAAKRCHVALGCRHYSLFDFRVDPQGQPWFLEAGLYCSFAPKSVVVMMVEAAGTSLKDFFRQTIDDLPLQKNTDPSSDISRQNFEPFDRQIKPQKTF